MGYLCSLAEGEETNNDSDNNESDNDSSIVEFDIDSSRVTAVDFNNELTLMQNDMLFMLDVLFRSDSASAELNHENALFEAQMSMAELDEMEFDGSEVDFVREMKELMNFYIKELEGEFKMILPLLKKSELSADEDEMLSNYDQRFALDEKAYFMKVFEAQDAFAAQHNIELVEH